MTESRKEEDQYTHYDNGNKPCDDCGDIYHNMIWFTLLQKIMRIQRKWYGLSNYADHV